MEFSLLQELVREAFLEMGMNDTDHAVLHALGERRVSQGMLEKSFRTVGERTGAVRIIASSNDPTSPGGATSPNKSGGGGQSAARPADQ